MRRVEIDWVKAVAGALAAVASAVLLSTLGAAGTILGAAIGSLVVTIGSSLFSQGLTTTRETLTKAQAKAAQDVGIAEAEVLRAGRAEDTLTRESHLEHAEERLAAANRELDEAALVAAQGTVEGPGWRERLAALPWKHIAWVSAGLFVAALVAITAFEVVSGRTVSSITGGSDNTGTTIGHVRDGSGGKKDPQPSETPEPSDSASPSEGTEESPSPTPTPTPTESPTESPSATTTPSDTFSASPAGTERPAGSASP